MKKIAVMLLAALICLSTACALAADYTSTAGFAITYDDQVYTLDDQTYLEENPNDELRWLFMLYDDKMIIESEIEKLLDYPELDFRTASEEDRQSYINYFMDACADENPILVNSLITEDQNLPILVFSLEDEEGTYYMAETVLDGCAIDFYCYYDVGNVDSQLLDQLEGVMLSFMTVE